MMEIMLNLLPLNLPKESQSYLLLDAEKRDVVTARRVNLLRILWRERYITRDGLVQRVEIVMGYASFGEKSWKDNFYRDMRVVKTALKRSGYDLNYSRRREKPGYYLAGESDFHPDEEKAIQGALRELDPHQIEIYKRISPAQKFFQACSITNLAKKVSTAEGKS
jgi:hypothetical protein